MINETGKSPNLRFGHRWKWSRGNYRMESSLLERTRYPSPTRIWLKKETQQLGPLIHTTWARTQVRLSIASFNKSNFLFSFLFLNNYCTGFSIKQKWNVIQKRIKWTKGSLSHYILQHTVLIYCLIIMTRSVRLIKVLL